jgi:hypothetical protein
VPIDAKNARAEPQCNLSHRLGFLDLFINSSSFAGLDLRLLSLSQQAEQQLVASL